ncbi:MAG: 2-phospho-L-lactate transferase [Polyangiaceae bacterium]|nr:2-phospho-L-lactate transferase [Polyangiaceae bacterium]
MTTPQPKVVALSGGVGGAKLVHGLARALPAGSLTAVVNTGDDFEHLGLFVCPDLDTCMYTLAGLADDERGWGLAGESFHAIEMLARYAGDSWFALGDRDLATHLLRTEALRRGESLTEVTARLSAALGVRVRILPMTDAPRSTVIDTESEGTLGFQHWLVRRRAEPRVRSVRYVGADEPTAEVIAALHHADLVVFCPSNPYVSLDPILTLTGVRDALAGKRVIAVSPIVHGRAVKGPLAAMIPALDGREPTPSAIAARYSGLLSGIVVENGDETGLDLPLLATSTVMRTHDDRERLAREVLAFAEHLG